MSVFDINEIEMIVNGLPFIDIDDWENNTEYKGAYYKNHQVIRWFWKEMQTFNQKQLAKILQFCTGSSRVPVEGFRYSFLYKIVCTIMTMYRVLQSNRGEFRKFCIESTKYWKENSLIKAHTCFNRLDLPQYLTETLVQENIKIILDSDFSGVFGIE